MVRRRIAFKNWQWTEVGALIPVMWVQIVFLLVLDQHVLAFLVGLVVFAMLAHILTWLVPLISQADSDPNGQADEHAPRTPNAGH